MAILHVSDLEFPLTENQVVKDILHSLGITFNIWDVSKLPQIHTNYVIVQDSVLAAYHNEVEAIKLEGDYASADVVGLFPNMPNLEELKQKFKKPHYHTDDEIRFCVHGSGVFHVYDDGKDRISVELTPGDYIRIPADLVHSFELTPANTMIAIRIFKDSEGWVAHYV